MTFKKNNDMITIEEDTIVCSREIDSKFYTIIVNVKTEETLVSAITKINNVLSLEDSLFEEFAKLKDSID